jgi:hypothetical protein
MPTSTARPCCLSLHPWQSRMPMSATRGVFLISFWCVLNTSRSFRTLMITSLSRAFLDIRCCCCGCCAAVAWCRYTGLLYDDERPFWARLPKKDTRYTALFEWRGTRGGGPRKLVVDATKYGGLTRFIAITNDPSRANVKLDIGHCECGISDPIAVLVAYATKKIDAGARLMRYEDNVKPSGGSMTVAAANGDEAETSFPGCVRACVCVCVCAVRACVRARVDCSAAVFSFSASCVACLLTCCTHACACAVSPTRVYYRVLKAHVCPCYAQVRD